ncbi:peroxiredoxin family protein [Flavobacterium urocaniciphilum]|uniref:Thiol-disulfide isomerase or thioredoxin n=1 Tax=Flavobacterium urocaniciphilum TaxID=1299341 RepID=A0A1H9CWT6_9FLAO|nr:redoxin domain-containing protein [Flavobacterium urocaniciphilum]SEQ05611.1 Thiol-disulfide isomerase or thioredoxin [Flavobacterium urocaniciphilum]
MKKFYLLFLMFSITASANVDTIAVFSESVKANFKKYVSLSNKAYNKKNYQKAERLFDSLVNNSLKGTHFDDFSFKRLGKSRIQLSKIEKPILLITYSSWCIMGKGEIPALNQLANEYREKMKIVVVFWNKKRDMKKLAKKFDKDIIVCYAHDSEYKDLKTISYLKKTFGFPTSYLIDENMELVDIQKNFVKPENKMNMKNSLDFYYHKFNSGLTSLIVNDGFDNTRMVGN